MIRMDANEVIGDYVAPADVDRAVQSDLRREGVRVLLTGGLEYPKVT